MIANRSTWPALGTRPNRFSEAGPISSSSSREYIYVTRSADRELRTLLTRGEFCSVLAPRQSGKTSLCNQLKSEAETEGFTCVYVDLCGFPSYVEEGVDALFELLARRTASTLGFSFDAASWDLKIRSSRIDRLIEFFLNHALPLINKSLLIFVDEIDCLRKIGSDAATADNFLAGLRYFHNQRNDNKELMKVVICLLGCIAPSDLKRDPKTSPYNIAKTVALEDFSRSELDQLRPGLMDVGLDSKKLLDALFEITEGHPRMCSAICHKLIDVFNEKSQKYIKLPEKEIIGLISTELFGSLMENPLKDGAIHFEGHEAEIKLSMARYYLEILRSGAIPVTGSDEEDRLFMTGIVARRQNSETGVLELRTRNSIFAQIFDMKWASKHLARAELSAVAQAWDRSGRRYDYLWRGIRLGTNYKLVKSGLRTESLEAQFLEASWQRGRRRQQNLRLAAIIITIFVLWNSFLNYTLKKKYSELDKSREQLNEAQGQLKETQGQLKETQGQLKETQGQLQPAQGQLKEAQGQLKEARGQLEKTRGQLEKTQGQLQPAQVQLKDARGQLEETQGQLADAQGQLAGAQGQLKEAQGQLADAQGQLVDAQGQLAKGTTELSRQTKLLERLATISRLRAGSISPARETKSDGILHAALLALADGPTSEEAIFGDPSFREITNQLLWAAVQRDGKAFALGGDLEGSVELVAFSALDSRFFACAKGSNGMRLWDLHGSKPTTLRFPQVSGDFVCPNMVAGPWVAVASPTDGRLFLWDTITEESKSYAIDVMRGVRSLSFSIDGTRLVVAGGKSIAVFTLPVMAASPWQPHTTLKGQAAFYAADISRRGELVVGVGEDNTVRVWSVARQQGLWVTAQSARVRVAKFSPSGEQVLIGGVDRRLRILNARSGRTVSTLPTPACLVWTAGFNQDGTRLVTACENGHLQVWSVTESRPLMDLQVNSSPIRSASFSADGSKVAIGDKDGSIKIIPVTFRGIREAACNIVFGKENTSYQPLTIEDKRLLGRICEKAVATGGSESGR